jgi:hypothetical protein
LVAEPLLAAGVGNGSKVIWTVKVGLCAVQLPLLEPLAPLELDLAELCRLTAPTPSIRRSR